MIFADAIQGFQNDYMIESLKRGTKKIVFNIKQLKLIFTKVLGDLQKELSIIETALSITTTAGTSIYPLDRSFMKDIAAYYGSTVLEKKSADWITNQLARSDTPVYYAIKTTGGIPSLILYPTPKTSGDTVIVRYYEDFSIYSFTVGIDAKISSSYNGYLNIPTMYDAAILMGMMAQIYDDRIPFYTNEKIRLKIIKGSGARLDYNMDGIPSSPSPYYNSVTDVVSTTTGDYKSNVVLAGTKNSVNLIFIIPDTLVANSESIYLNGIRQVRSVDYTILDSTVSMTIAPDSGDFLVATYLISAVGTLTTVTGIDLIGTKNSVNLAFTLPSTPILGSVGIYLNGVLQTVTTDYAISGINITMVVAPDSGDYLEANYLTI